MQDPGTLCMKDLRQKALEDCEKKKIKYSEIRTDIIPVLKLSTNAFSLNLSSK